MFKIFVVALAFCFMPIAAQAGDVNPSDGQAIDSKVDAFFRDINEGHVDTALSQTFLPRMSTDNKTTLQGLTTQLQVAVNFAAPPLRWEMISQDELASVLVARTYVVYSKDVPAKFKFIFFKTPDGWYMQSMYFGDFNAQDY